MNVTFVVYNYNNNEEVSVFSCLFSIWIKHYSMSYCFSLLRLYKWHRPFSLDIMLKGNVTRHPSFFLERISSLVLKNVRRLQLEVICPEAYKRRIKDILCTPKPVHTKTTYIKGRWHLMRYIAMVYWYSIKGPWKSIVPSRPLVWHCTILIVITTSSTLSLPTLDLPQSFINYNERIGLLISFLMLIPIEV